MDDFCETAQMILNENGYEDWEVEDDCLLIGPDGELYEWDHARSPLRKLGFI
jgi:hypothetical protein